MSSDAEAEPQAASLLSQAQSPFINSKWLPFVRSKQIFSADYISVRLRIVLREQMFLLMDISMCSSTQTQVMEMGIMLKILVGISVVQLF